MSGVTMARSRDRRLFLGMSGVLMALTACGSLPTATGSLPIPPNLSLDGNSAATPAPPVATSTPLVLNSSLRSQLNLTGQELALFVRLLDGDLVAQLPGPDVARWISPDGEWPGIEGIDVSLAVGDYRETATARLRFDQPATFTFADIPAGSVAELTATAFSGPHTLAAGDLTFDLAPEDGEDPAVAALELLSLDVPLLKSVQVRGGPVPTTEGHTVQQPLPLETLILTGETLDQVTQVLFTIPPISQPTDAPRQQLTAPILNQTATELTVQPPATLALETSTLAVETADGLGLGNLDVTWLSPTTSSSTVSTLITQEPKWQVQPIDIQPNPSNPIELESPSAVIVDDSGSLYIADSARHQILMLNTDGELTIMAGSGEAGFQDAETLLAEFDTPVALAFDRDGSLLVVDQGNHAIRRIDTEGSVSTVAGRGNPGYADGPAADARFRDPAGLAVGVDGLIYVADAGNHRIRRITPEGLVVTFAGSGRAGFEDGVGILAQLDTPVALDFDNQGRLWVIDQGNHSLRHISITGQVNTVTGGESGFRDGSFAEAQFDRPSMLTITPDDMIWLADQDNHRIRQLSLTTQQVITFAGTGQPGFRNGPVAQAQFDHPAALSLTDDKALVVIDRTSPTLREVFQPKPLNQVGLRN